MSIIIAVKRRSPYIREVSSPSRATLDIRIRTLRMGIKIGNPSTAISAGLLPASAEIPEISVRVEANPEAPKVMQSKYKAGDTTGLPENSEYISQIQIPRIMSNKLLYIIRPRMIASADAIVYR
jgi:hypothetical protein